MSPKQAYVAYFDVLGFSEVVRNHGTADLEKIVRNLFTGFNQAIDKSRIIKIGKPPALLGDS